MHRRRKRHRSPAERACQQSPVQTTKADGRACVRHRQTGDRLAPDEHARTGQGPGRMKLGEMAWNIKRMHVLRAMRGQMCAPITSKPDPGVVQSGLMAPYLANRCERLISELPPQKKTSRRSIALNWTQVRQRPKLQGASAWRNAAIGVCTGNATPPRLDKSRVTRQSLPG